MSAGWDGILNIEMIIEGMRPEFVSNIVSGEESTDTFFSGAMGIFDRTILMASISIRRMNAVAVTFK